MFGWNEIAFFVFLLCIIVYVVLMIICRMTGNAFKRASLNRIYRNWVDARLDDTSSHIITVQTIRNSIMSNSIFISALLLFLSIIIGLFTGEFLVQSEDFLGTYISVGIVQVTTIAVVSIISLISFILSVRMLQRSQLLITANTKKREDIFEKTYDLIQKTFLAAQTHWMGGIRGIFYLIATVTWLLNPIVFLITTVSITVFLIGWHDLSLFSREDRK